MVFCHGVIPCTYSLAKELLLIAFGTSNENNVKKAMAILITILALICLGFLALPCLLFKFTIFTYLKLRYRQHFGTFLSIDTMTEYWKLTITYVYIMEHRDSYKDVIISTKEACNTLYKSNFKFTSVVGKCCGFYYFLKDQVHIDHIVSVIDKDCGTEDDLLRYLESTQFKDFDSKIKLWDVKVFKKPITWRCSDKIYYPIIVRFNHCIGDAVCLSVFQNKYFLTDVIQNKFENAMIKSKRSEDVLKRSDCLRLALNMRKMESIYLRLPNDDVENVGVFIENQPKYLELIRKLSQNLKCTFTHVVLLAFTASVLDYLKSENVSPTELLIGHTCREISEDITKLCKAKLLLNNETVESYKIPCLNEENLEDRLESWLNILSQGRKMGTFQNLFILRKMATYFPSFVVEFLFSPLINKSCVGLTNIPGPDWGKIGNIAIKDSFVLVNRPYGLSNKFVMVLHSYGGRLQASLVPHKEIRITKKCLQSILLGTFSKIDELSCMF